MYILFALVFGLVANDCLGASCVEMNDLMHTDKLGQQLGLVQPVGKLGDTSKCQNTILVTPKVGDDGFMLFDLDGSGDWGPVEVKCLNSDE